jgi:hypothetical protein
MNKELALRTFAYLIGHYKTNNETTINKQEIEAMEFILKDNESLEQQCKKQKEYNQHLHNLNNTIFRELLNKRYENKKQKEVIDKLNNYIDNYDVFKVFSFPLMKKWEENQVKSSIDYEFKTSLIKDLKDILNEVSE